MIPGRVFASRGVATLALVVSLLMTAATAMSAQERGAVLSPGDAIRITVWRMPEMSGEFVIAPDGSITHPLYRTVTVAGLGMAEVESRIRSFLQRFGAQPEFVVEPLFQIVIGGEVNQPGVYTVRPGTPLVNVLAQAGGVTERGRRDRVRLARRGNVTTIDLTRLAGREAQTPVESGDHIVVERERAIFRDVIGPTMALIAAVASVVTVVTQQ